MATNKNEIEINGVTYVPKSDAEPVNSDIKIVILQRSWVMIGRWSQKGDVITLRDAYVIRTWGTSKGLGELALEGKKTNTKLDKAGIVRFNKLTVVAAIDCLPSLWDEEL